MPRLGVTRWYLITELPQLHLQSNVPAKEVTFKKFEPKGQVSIYEFLSAFEEWWCHGFVSDMAKPRLLYSKYLHHLLMSSYEELKARKHNFADMTLLGRCHLLYLLLWTAPAGEWKLSYSPLLPPPPVLMLYFSTGTG
jgi:hypothetical protein